MTDLLEEVVELGHSSRLISVASALGKLLKNESLTEDEKERLKWAGSMMEEIDWDGPHYGRGDFPATQATSLRPLLFRAFRELGFVDDFYNRAFFDNLYDTLQSGGEEITLSREGLEAARKITQYMADRILANLQRGSGYI